MTKQVRMPDNSSIISWLEEMVHSQDDFVMTDSEFAFGWHFFVL